MKNETVTQFVQRALKLPVTAPLSPAPRDSSCPFCGAHIQQGEGVVPLYEVMTNATLKTTFTDGRELGPDKAHVCPACATLAPKYPYHKDLLKCFITEAGAFTLAKDSHRSWFWQNLPEPPFVVLAHEGLNFQHTLWKASITYSKELVFVRLKGLTARVRTGVLRDATAIAQKFTSFVPKRNHPFLYLDRKLTARSGNILRPDVFAAAKAAGLHAEIRLMENLSIGEIWALTSLVNVKNKPPAKPEAINLGN